MRTYKVTIFFSGYQVTRTVSAKNKAQALEVAKEEAFAVAYDMKEMYRKIKVDCWR